MSFDLFEYFAFFGEHALPGFFEPSFLQNLLEKEYRNMPAQGVVGEGGSGIQSKKPDFASAEKPGSSLQVRDKTCL